MPALARTLAVEEHRPDRSEPIRTPRHQAEEALVRLYIRFFGFYAVVVVATSDGVGVVIRGRNPHRALETLGFAKSEHLGLVRVWWTQTHNDAVALQLAFAATLLPSDELIPALLSFAREHTIPLTSDTVVQAKARALVEWVDADFESMRFSGRMKNWVGTFGGGHKELSARLRRAKMRTLYRIAQTTPRGKLQAEIAEKARDT